MPQPWIGAPFPPRRWQAHALPIVLEAIETGEHGAVSACTGSGKSVLIAEVVSQALARGWGRVVVLTPTKRLVEQLAATIGARVGASRVGRFYTQAKEAQASVVIACNASSGTLADALDTLGGGVGLLIADELHRTEAVGVQDAVDRLKPQRRIGFSATSFRSLESESIRLFRREIVRYTLADALRDGVVVPWEVIPWTRAATKLDDACLSMLRPYVGAGRIVANAKSIPDAEGFAARATDAGIRAVAVHSRMTPEEQERRLDDLKDGRVRMVVFPSLLSEGVDYPWLQTLLLRRKSGAAVLFVQTVGRVLRTFPGKTKATILDPHGLFGTFSLLNEARLGPGGELPDAASEEEEPSPDITGEQIDLWPAPEESELRPLQTIAIWAALLRQAAEADGVVGARAGVKLNASAPTPRQMDTLGRMLKGAGWLPPEHARLLRDAVAIRAIPSVEAASALIDVLGGLIARRSTWTPTLPIWLPDVTLDGLAVEMTSARVEASAVVSKEAGVTVILVTQGPRTVYQEVRPMHDGDLGYGAQVKAVLKAAERLPAVEVWVDRAFVADLVMGRREGSTQARMMLKLYPHRPVAISVATDSHLEHRALLWKLFGQAKAKRAASIGRVSSWRRA